MATPEAAARPLHVSLRLAVATWLFCIGLPLLLLNVQWSAQQVPAPPPLPQAGTSLRFISPRLLPPMTLRDADAVEVVLRHATPLIDKGEFMCPQNLRCRVTDWSGESEGQPTDAIVFDRRKASYDTLPAQKSLNQAWVLFSSETPVYDELDGAGPPKEYAAFWRLFDMLSSYRLDSAVPFPYFRRWVWPSIQRVSGSRPRTATAPIVWAVSNCDAFTDRVQYAKQLMKYIPVHIFGKCSPNMPWPMEGENKPLHLHQLLMPYKFYLAFENTNCIDYCTEKLYTAYILGLVPIVMGCKSLRQFFLPAPLAALHVDDFPGPKALAAEILRLHRNDTAYRERLAWREPGAVVDPRFLRLWNGTSTAGPYECRLCAAVRRFQQQLGRQPLAGVATNPDFSCDDRAYLRMKRCSGERGGPLCDLSVYTVQNNEAPQVTEADILNRHMNY
eukprot:GGOE01014546.1.p1 GENE.GGOE01014546.1~~GGOE01014546.1.p1  ORF type:complete len:457 (-),score=116.48 GGOE01014546.1:107-1441(-)